MPWSFVFMMPVAAHPKISFRNRDDVRQRAATRYSHSHDITRQGAQGKSESYADGFYFVSFVF
jgi:hypothetical protein